MQARAIALLAASVFLTASSFVADSASAQTVSARPIGKVLIATGSVTIEHSQAMVVQANLGSVGQTKVGDPVFLGDVVQTGADGKVGVTFTDGTAFNLTSNARMVLNEFVYDPNGKANSTLFSLTKGSFTFVAGKVAKTGDMKIDTPVATMGIRGTTPHVEIGEDGTVRFSTLIEENKKKVQERRSPPAPQRQANNGAPQGKAVPDQVGSAIDKSINVKLKICNGC
jgi:hypothetical protein